MLFFVIMGTYWEVPSLAEIGTQKHILDKLAEMQVFEYLTLNCLLQMVHI